MEERLKKLFVSICLVTFLVSGPAKTEIPNQKFLSLGIAPPHLHIEGKEVARQAYENQLKSICPNLH